MSDWAEMVDLTLEKKKCLSKQIEAIDPNANLSAEVENLFSSKQLNINSKNCALILEELKNKYSPSESGNEPPV